MADEAERIIDLYRRHAHAWDQDRGRSLFERPWLDRFLAHLPPKASILDLGCGGGEPIARYLVDQGHAMTGIDTAPDLIALCEKRFPRFPAHAWSVADMRRLFLGRTFNGLLAWDSFFHLRADDQRRSSPSSAGTPRRRRR